MDDFERFESPKLLIKGAKASIVEFEAACKAFLDDQSYDVITHIDPNTREQVFKLRFQRRIINDLRLSAYRIVTDLRHALDQAICDAAGSLGAGPKLVDKLYFPFAKTAVDLDARIKGFVKLGIDADLLSFVRGFNPHYGGDDMLYAFNVIAGPNKHQRIVSISRGAQGFVISGNHPWDLYGRPKIGINRWSDLRNELEFMRLRPGDISTAQIGRDLAPVLQIVIGTGEPPLAGPAATVLAALASKVESIVLGLEAETARMQRARS